MNTPRHIEEFRGVYRFLSNFYPCTVVHDGLTYPSVEHFYVAMKTIDPATRVHVSNIVRAGDAKQYGQERISKRPDWDAVRYGVMWYGLTQKFADPTLRDMLLATGDAVLVEGNTWGDETWGVNTRTGRGNNMLGRMLMRLRGELMGKPVDTACTHKQSDGEMSSPWCDVCGDFMRV